MIRNMSTGKCRFNLFQILVCFPSVMTRHFYVHPISDCCLGNWSFRILQSVYYLWQVLGLKSWYLSVSDEKSSILQLDWPSKLSFKVRARLFISNLTVNIMTILSCDNKILTSRWDTLFKTDMKYHNSIWYACLCRGYTFKMFITTVYPKHSMIVLSIWAK